MDAEVIAFVSGKGGTGKSTLSVHIGGALAALGKRVLLVELDSGLRSVDIIAGVSGQTVYDIEDVLSGAVRPGKAVVPSPLYRGLSVISAPYAGGDISTKSLQVLCQKLSPFFDYILIDTAAGMGAPYMAAIAVAKMVIFVLTPDPIALRDGRILIDEMQENTLETRLLLNKVNAKRVLKDGLLRDLDEAIDIVGVQLLGVVPNSTGIFTASTSGVSLVAGSLERDIFTAIAKRLLKEDVPLFYP